MNSFKLYDINNITSIKQNDLLDKSQKISTSGRQAWTVLHTYSAYLPDKLSFEEEDTFRKFFESVIHFSTKKHNKWKVNSDKIDIKMDFSTRENAMLSLCHYHNQINWELNKDQFFCDINKLTEVYGSNKL